MIQQSEDAEIYGISFEEHFDIPQSYKAKSTEYYYSVFNQLLLTGQSKRIKRDRAWFFVRLNVGKEMPQQGWKIHVASTPEDGLGVLSDCAQILIESNVSFKFLVDKYLLEKINSNNWSRESAGKFITAYPTNEDEFKELAEKLHQATLDRKSSRILSDRRYKGGSIHYRYGAFYVNHLETDYGVKIPIIASPDGNYVRDSRNAAGQQPSWIVDPFTSTEAVKEKPKSILLNHRFKMTSVIRYANRGGVYIAQDIVDSSRVLIKEARPFVNHNGKRDSVDQLKTEEANLKLLSSTSVPRVVDSFSIGGHYFLAQEFLDGITLRNLVSMIHMSNDEVIRGEIEKDRQKNEDYVGLMKDIKKFDGSREFILRIAEEISKVHKLGYVVNDLSPQNIMVDSDGAIRIIDLEHLGKIGALKSSPGTPGYFDSDDRSSVSEIKNDWYSFGMLVYLIITGHDPIYLHDPCNSKSFRMSNRLDVSSYNSKYWSKLIELSQRHECTYEDILSYLSADEAGEVKLFQPQFENILTLENIEIPYLIYLKNAMKKSAYSTWFTSQFGFGHDPSCLSTGYAGILLFLARNYNSFTDDGKDLANSMIEANIDKLIEAEQLLSNNSLFLGRAGLLLAMTVISENMPHMVGIDYVSQRAQLLRPMEMGDFMLGNAGIIPLLCKIHKMCPSANFGSLINEIAGDLQKHAQDDGRYCFWHHILKSPLDESESTDELYGFAHGVAGYGFCMLRLFEYTGDVKYKLRIERIINYLKREEKMIDGLSYWSHGKNHESRFPYWCNGSSGVGTFLIRAQEIMDDESNAMGMAQRSAKSVMSFNRLRSYTQCCGIAGNGEFLMDMYKFTQNQDYLDKAEEFARFILIEGVHRKGGVSFPSSNTSRLSDDLWFGASGIVNFLLRVRDRNDRRLIIDDLS